MKCVDPLDSGLRSARDSTTHQHVELSDRRLPTAHCLDSFTPRRSRIAAQLLSQLNGLSFSDVTNDASWWIELTGVPRHHEALWRTEVEKFTQPHPLRRRQ